jgi:hypothetical protein
MMADMICHKVYELLMNFNLFKQMLVARAIDFHLCDRGFDLSLPILVKRVKWSTLCQVVSFLRVLRVG